MPFKYPCFISYVHGRERLVTDFLTQLKQLLADYLEPFFDEQLFIDDLLTPGVDTEEALADAICHSVCMIVVFSPRYAEHAFCRREYRAMEILEAQRMSLLGAASEGRGLIIPIVLRGQGADIPDKIRNHKHYCNFAKFTTASGDISKDPEYVKEIDKIASYIFRLKKDLEKLEADVCCGCHAFRLPEDEGMQLWGGGFKPEPPKLPFR